MHFRIAILSFFVFISYFGNAQQFSVKTFVGTSYYLGDLAPYTHNLSFSKGRAAFGIAVSHELAPSVKLSGRFYRGMLEGTDELARDFNRRRRNLSFESPLTEFALTTDIYLSELIPIMKKWGVDMYVYSGVSLFRFNPRTLVDGVWVDLQPLGTEGQGIVEFGGIPKYKLTQVGIPLGFGIEFEIAPMFSLGFEIAPRLTFTDYLDDVSTDYVDYELQSELQGDLTARLGNRIAEFEYGEEYHTLVANGQQPHIKGYVRGDPSDNDWYLFSNVTLSYFISKLDKKEEQEKQLSKDNQY